MLPATVCWWYSALFPFLAPEADAAEGIINSDLNRISLWADANHLVLNPVKCQHILLGSKHHRPLVSVFHLYISGTKIPHCCLVANLGVILDSDFNFSRHISRLCQSAYHSWKQLLPFRNMFDEPTKLLLVESLVLSLFNYCDVLYGLYIASADNYRLQKIPNLCIRFVTCVPPFCHIIPFIRHFRRLKVQGRRLLHYMVLLSSQSPPYFFS